MKKIVLLTCVALSLVGCGKKSDVAEQFDAAQEEVQSEDGNENASQDTSENTKAEGVPEHYKSEMKVDDELTINIDAKITSLGYNDMKIYRIEERKIDGAYLENLAKNIFDAGEFTNSKPYRVWSEVELIAEKNRLNEMNKEAPKGCRVSPERLEDIDCFLEHRAAEADTQPDGDDPYVYVSTFTDVSTGEFTRCQMEYTARLRGKIDGKEYELCYEQHNGAEQEKQTKLWLSPVFPFYEKEEHNFTFMAATGDVTIGAEKGTDYSQRVNGIVGNSSIVPEKLEPQAKQFLVKSGFKDYVLVATRARYAYGDDGLESELCGFDFYYEPTAINLDTSGNLDVGIETHGNPVDQFIRISVCEDGIMDVDFNDKYEIKEVIGDETSMLTLDQVKEAAENAFVDKKEELKESGLFMMLTDEDFGGEITTIRLRYQKCEYDNQMVYMPMWIFGMDYGVIGVMDTFEINAVDGSFQEWGGDNYWCDRGVDY